MLDKINEIEAKFDEVGAALSAPETLADMQEMARLSKEYKDLEAKMVVGRKYRSTANGVEGAREILAEEADEELREMAKEELQTLEPRLEELEGELKQLLIPKDPEDSKNVILEIRAGAGGDEAAIFAGDLLRMYQRFCDRQGFRFSIADYHEGTSGGYKEVSVNIEGEDCYGLLKFESGVHRVQRVPQTETQGRVHTSAATVAIMPEAEEFDVELNMNDVKKETFCSQGAGGQSVNTTYSAVRLTHEPTGVVVSMQNERSQIKNFELALKILRSRLYEIELQKRQEKEAELRRSLVSTGDRSAKIRTYNYPQGRVTDHRIGLTLYNLSAIMDGEISEIIEALRIHENAVRLEESA